MANALADATGIRFAELPLRPDLIYRAILEKHVGLRDPSTSV
jgi:CO/xanthine dehydrogenase Mo-binding subunit